MNSISISCIWFASLCLYLQSQHQVMLTSALAKPLAWCVSTGLCLGALFLLPPDYSVGIHLLQILSLFMLFLPLQTLLSRWKVSLIHGVSVLLLLAPLLL